mgnify:CR=1 FL=1
MLELLLNITTNKSANPNSKISEAITKGSLDLVTTGYLKLSYRF